MRLARGVWLAAALVVAGLAYSSAQEVRRAPSMGFMGMRGKKSPPAIFPDDEAVLEEYKRVPGMGFQGMRGKKAPSMGFMGMRGKKDDMADFWDEEKRAPASGFFGMRGKKAPNSGFFGMRGKKAPSSGFFGTRGKKGPSGFIGMRGKKDDFEDIDSLLDYLRAADPRIGGEEDFMDSRAKRYAPEDNFQENSSEQEFL